jgi:hypothetical protein
VKSQRQASRSVTRGRSWLISDEYSVFNGGASRQLLPLATGVQTPCLKTLMINKATSLKWYCDRLSRTCESRCHSRYHLWCVNATVGEEERHEKMSLQYVRWRSVVTMQALVVGARAHSSSAWLSASGRLTIGLHELVGLALLSGIAGGVSMPIPEAQRRTRENGLAVQADCQMVLSFCHANKIAVSPIFSNSLLA